MSVNCPEGRVPGAALGDGDGDIDNDDVEDFTKFNSGV